MAKKQATTTVADIVKVTFTIQGIAPLMFGKPVHEERRDNETHAQLDERTWQQRCHISSEGVLQIPSAAIHKSLIKAGSWLSMKLEGRKTFTARFTAGIITLKPYFDLKYKGKDAVLDDVEKLPLYVPSDGKPGGTTRVWRIFPVLNPPWSLDGELLITDEAISQDIFERHLRTSGLHDGVGSMRKGRGGPNGMFSLESTHYEPYEL